MDLAPNDRKTVLRPFMKPRPGYVIVRQAANFGCSVCGETDFPTVSSLVYHQRKEHSMQLLQLEHWLHCSGCDLSCTSLSTVRTHIAQAAGEQPPCSWATISLLWQAEEGSEEAKRFLAGLDPVPSTASSSSGLASASILPGVTGTGANTPSTSKSHLRNKRVDKSYMLPRPGHVIMRSQQNLMCRLCGDGGFMTCSSVEHHIRTKHNTGIHTADMWMHCGRCSTDFANISSVRTHVASGAEESCSWQHIVMSWHEKEEQTLQANNEDDGMVGFHQADIARALGESLPPPKRYRKHFKPPTTANEGFEIVKRAEDIPCFGCGVRCPSMRWFLSHMQGKHRLYCSDIGAWMECACGQQFTSTTALRVHIRESGGELPVCYLPQVSLCWQHRMGRWETETPCWRGIDPNAVVTTETTGSVEEEWNSDDDIYDPECPQSRMDGGGIVVKEEMDVGFDLDNLLQQHHSHSSSAEGIRRDPNSSVPPLDEQLTAFIAALPTSATEMTTHFDPKMASGGGEVKEEQSDEEEEVNEMGVVRNEEEVGQGRRRDIFDPTSYNDGDRFVLRKKAEMMCRTCGKHLDTPIALAAHLNAVHEEEMRGLDRDWISRQWLECVACRAVFHTAEEHEQHLLQQSTCSPGDVRLCWMEKEEPEKRDQKTFY